MLAHLRRCRVVVPVAWQVLGFTVPGQAGEEIYTHGWASILIIGGCADGMPDDEQVSRQVTPGHAIRGLAASVTVLVLALEQSIVAPAAVQQQCRRARLPGAVPPSVPCRRPFFIPAFTIALALIRIAKNSYLHWMDYQGAGCPRLFPIRLPAPASIRCTASTTVGYVAGCASA
jgi:hypothetical protein